jgi:thioredoxin-like negative regulator of GroEL
LKLSRDRFEKRVKHKAANALLEEIAAKAASDAGIERAAAMILAVIDKADEIRELNRQIAAIPGSVVAREGTGS